MRWDDVRIFLAVARCGSLVAAGEQLDVSPASVARHVEELERRLGVTLFLRSRNGYALSDAGLAVIGDADNAGSIGVHRALGFEHTGVLKASGWKFDRWLDVILMQKALGPGAGCDPVDRVDA